MSILMKRRKCKVALGLNYCYSWRSLNLRYTGWTNEMWLLISLPYSSIFALLPQLYTRYTHHQAFCWCHVKEFTVSFPCPSCGPALYLVRIRTNATLIQPRPDGSAKHCKYHEMYSLCYTQLYFLASCIQWRFRVKRYSGGTLWHF